VQRRIEKAQARMLRAQGRAQRAQWKMQQRTLRQGSLVGPLVLVALGGVLLLEQTGKLSWTRSLEWYGRWWPAVLIAAGLVLMAEWMVDQRRQAETGQIRGTRVLGGGVVLLLILLASAGWSARWAEGGMMWRQHYLGHEFSGLDRVFGESHESDDVVSRTLPAGATLVVHNPYGAVTVTGSSEDGQVHVNVHKEVYAWRDSDAETKARQMQPVFSEDGTNIVLEVQGVERGQADLTIEVPRNAPVSVSADHGDVRVSELHAPLTIAVRSGDVDLSGIAGPVTAHVNNDDSSVAAHSVAGTFTLQGRAGDISLSEIDGAVTLQGDFFGTTQAEHITGPLRFETSRTRFATARVDGELHIERGDLQANQLLGPVTVTTRDRNIQLDDVSGPVQVGNRNGTVAVTSAAPLGQVEITNAHGSVDLGLPASSGFMLDAQAHNGDMENDFGLQAEGDDHQHRLSGKVGAGGPTVRVATTDGDVTVRKSVVAPVPPKPPAPPRITLTPPSAGGSAGGAVSAPLVHGSAGTIPAPPAKPKSYRTEKAITPAPRAPTLPGESPAPAPPSRPPSSSEKHENPPALL
jgi:DUF4097 and DUF4098 domain-containing protein YvlB